MIQPLYRVNLVEKDDQHFYTIDDNATFLPGVTGILSHISKPFLQQWAAKESALYCKKIALKLIAGRRRPKERFLDTMVKRAKKQHHFIKDKAAEIGTKAHSDFDRHLKGEVDMASDLPFQNSFAYFMKKKPFKILQGDSKVLSLKYQYGGSCDAIIEDDGKLAIADWKTGKSIYSSHGAQIGAYAQAVKETYGLDYLPTGYVVRFEKDKAKFEIKKVNTEIGFKIFKAALDLYQLEKFEVFHWSEIIKEKKTKK